jgi:hypothetical protein
MLQLIQITLDRLQISLKVIFFKIFPLRHSDMFYMPFDSPHQDKLNGTSFIISSSFYKKKYNFYHLPKIENILNDSFLAKSLFFNK